VGIQVDVDTATRAMEISLRELIAQVDATIPTPGTAVIGAMGLSVLSVRRRRA
jgi:uncharacterized protein (TIGR03382 family)